MPWVAKEEAAEEEAAAEEAVAAEATGEVAEEAPKVERGARFGNRTPRLDRCRRRNQPCVSCLLHSGPLSICRIQVCKTYRR
jgi:hypothetical protein